MTPYNVYCAYIEAKMEFTGKKSNILSEDKFLNKMSDENCQYIDTLAGWFNTRFSRIDIHRYMLAGFNLWKGFSYNKFLDERVIEEYINQDKRGKRNFISSPKTITQSMKVINKPLYDYCQEISGESKKIVDDFILGKIDPVIIIYCHIKKYINFNDTDKAKLSIIFNNYDSLREDMIKLRKVIVELDNLNHA